MDKKHKRAVKKRNARKSNQPADPKPTETKPTPKPIESELPIPPAKRGKQAGEQTVLERGDAGDSSGKKPLWKRGAVLVSSFLFLVLGFLGYDALWPRVVIDSSSAIDPGIISYQFVFENNACYPVEIKSVRATAFDMEWPAPSNWTMKTYGVQNVAFVTTYTNVQISGREAVTMKVNTLSYSNHPRNLQNGSIMKVKITYQVPVLHIEKSDSALFESAQDNSGNPIWTKRPRGEFANREASSVFLMGPNVVY